MVVPCFNSCIMIHYMCKVGEYVLSKHLPLHIMFVTDQTALRICQNNMHLCYSTFSGKENEFNLGDMLRNVKENVLQFSQRFAPYAVERTESENEKALLFYIQYYQACILEAICNPMCTTESNAMFVCYIVFRK